MPTVRERQLEIVVSQGDRHYARCLVAPGHYHLGQERVNDIMVDEPSVSAHHAWVYFLEEGAVFIQDAGSANGTYVDSEFAGEPLLISRSSQVQVGACRVHVREKAGRG